MKITKHQLKQIIKEELSQVLDEQDVEQAPDTWSGTIKSDASNYMKQHTRSATGEEDTGSFLSNYESEGEHTPFGKDHPTYAAGINAAAGGPTVRMRGHHATGTDLATGEEEWLSSRGFESEGEYETEQSFAQTPYTGDKKRWKGKPINYDRITFQPNYAETEGKKDIESISVGGKTFKKGTKNFDLALNIIRQNEETFGADAQAEAGLFTGKYKRDTGVDLLADD